MKTNKAYGTLYSVMDKLIKKFDDEITDDMTIAEIQELLDGNDD